MACRRKLGVVHQDGASAFWLFLVLLLLASSCCIAFAAAQEESSAEQEKESNEIIVEKENPTLESILKKSLKKAVGGGIPGAAAGLIQVMTLMWLRTLINYQSRYGGSSFRRSFATMYADGGIRRFYRGVGFALVQAPLSRFVSTAANDGINALLPALEMTKQWGPGRTTVVAALVVGAWRMLLMPIDTCKTVLQVDSVEGFRHLMLKVQAGQFSVLYQGAVAQAIGSFVSHYPWFYTYNFLVSINFMHHLISSQHIRNALIGLISGITSDVVSNCLRVVKTTKQAMGSKRSISYAETISMILNADGWRGLFGRGLKTRIMANALQSVLFTVVWRGLAERWGTSHTADKNNRRTELEGEEDEALLDNITYSNTEESENPEFNISIYDAEEEGDTSTPIS
jgi:hypothetical protein